MLGILVLSVVTASLIASTTSAGGGFAKSKSVICYYTNWAQNRQRPSTFTPDEIDASLCTHIVYAFFNFNGTNVMLSAPNDEVMIAKVMAFKKSHPNLKVVASIGGWAAGGSVFHDIIATPATRSTFNLGAIKFLRKYKFDGLDVDFEFPGASSRGSPPADKTRFTQWIKSLRQDFKLESRRSGNSQFLLSIAMSGRKKELEKGCDVAGLSSNVDFISVMSYDYHSALEPQTGLNAPLFPKSTWSPNSYLYTQTTNFTIEYLIRKGAAPEKMMMGVPLYGRSFTLAKSADNAIGSPAVGPGKKGRYTSGPGFISFFETCMLSKCTKTPYSVVFDNEAKVPYMFQGTNWITTEDVESVKAKVEFAMAKNLGGIMYWAMDLDDFGDLCKNGVRYPLMKSAINTLKGLPPPTLNKGNRSPAMCNAVSNLNETALIVNAMQRLKPFLNVI